MVGRLRSLQDGDKAIVDVVACGSRAVPFLRALLFAREPSGLTQVRRRVIQALAALGAEDVLLAYLKEPCEASDPVERAGDEDAKNIAAGCIRRPGEGVAFGVLLDLARRKPLPAAIAALGRSRRAEAIPMLVAALAEDACRLSAERALVDMDADAVPHLTAAALRREPSDEDESESSLRRRRSALQVLRDMGVPADAWPALREALYERDDAVALAAARIALECAPKPDRKDAVRRLLDIIDRAGAAWRMEIEDALTEHFEIAEPSIKERLEDIGDDPRPDSCRHLTRASLLRVMWRADFVPRAVGR